MATACGGNTKLLALRETAEPVAVIATGSGPPVLLSVTVSVPGFIPDSVGLTFTVTKQDCPGASIRVQVFVWEYLPAGVAATPATDTGAAVTLVTVNFSLADESRRT